MVLKRDKCPRGRNTVNRTPQPPLGGAYSITATGKIRLHVKIPIVDFGLPNVSREGNVQRGGAHGRWQGRYGAINLFFITVCLIFFSRVFILSPKRIITQ